MPRSLVEINGAFTVTHQAVCQHGDFEGDQQNDINDAYRDANMHNRQPGCRFHVIDVVTHQTMFNRFISPDIDDFLRNNIDE